MQDLNDLQYFAQVVRHGGFSAASRATGEPKSKLSKRVAQLERDLGVRLIERSTRSVQVTDIGREVFAQCEIIAGGVDATEAIVARSRDEVRGNLQISCPPQLPLILGPGPMTSFLNRYPLVRVQLHLSNRRVDLINERVDVAFRIRSDLDTDQSLTVRTLGSSHLVLVADPALLAGRVLRTPEDLAQLPTVSMGEHLDRDRWDLVSVEGETRSFVHAPRLCCEELSILRAAALAGVGVALLPEDCCMEDVRRGVLVHVLPEWSTPEGIVHLVFTTTRGMLPAVRAFVDHFAQAFSVMRGRGRMLVPDRDDRVEVAPGS
ncbi:MAG: LysR-family transcriptional regulator [Rhodopila sp.]|nr:LysR-family transcriptional regulator [Rhodopila sp.]